MKTLLSIIPLTATLFALSATACLAAATISQTVDPPEANVGDMVTVTYTIQNGNSSDIQLPSVDGLQVAGKASGTNITVNNGSFTMARTQSFSIVASHAGDFTIPAFDIHLQDGGTLRTQPAKIHILASSSAPAQNNPQSGAAANQTPTFNPYGPVVMPNNNGAQPNPNPQPPPPDNSGTPPPPDVPGGNANAVNDGKVPTDPDGRPAKVFVVITPQTADAYVGQSIPMRIEWYIRVDVAAQQDSLPTIKGSDFLMNNLSTRPAGDTLMVNGEGYDRETWSTAISAPKSGDYPLQMERDTYWLKSMNPSRMDPFTNYFPGRPALAHESIPSNQLTIHVHQLPTDGKPASFSGAIGQFTVTGASQPDTVTVGEPVTLHFTVTGQGNFDYVKCPVLAEDPAWKAYTPSAKTTYQDESHTQGTKTFEMAVIPQKNGQVQLPQALFSYFDPSTKQYVTTPVNLPMITVTGQMASSTAASGATTDASASTPGVAPAGFSPNRDSSGSIRADLTPIYRQTWFWVAQGGLVTLLVLGALILFFRSQAKPDHNRAERLQREQSLALETDAMGQAAQNGDAMAFFTAARHAVQLQLSAQWKARPESITLGEIRQRDPQLAESLEPLFVQADEIIYSGGTGRGLDLAQWDRHVRELLQQSQAVRT
jgi:hypothetical protein